MEGFSGTVTMTTISGDASFFVSPARHGEAQDMSGDLKQTKQTKGLPLDQQQTQIGSN
jgi:hypothetical protein